MAGKNVIELTGINFDEEVINSDQPVLVDFWAPWCGPCRMVGPIVDEIADQYVGKAKVGKVNVDEQKNLAMEYQVMSIPTLILFKDGKPVNKAVGARPKNYLEDMINQQL
ncbi:MAG: thioredoxin [Clostridia bacterium]|nr:thioredoxin [Clostridia bacterium]